MRNSIPKLLKPILFFLGVIVLLPIAFLLYISLTDFKPKVTANLEIYEAQKQILTDTSVFKILSWNIGYAGLDKDMDFFYDGGKSVRTSRSKTEKNLENILNIISSDTTIDFFFFQEVDQKSKRSYFMDQSNEIQNVLKDYNGVFSENYDVAFVPMPLAKPMGSVHAGMMTFSKYTTQNAKRFSYPNIATWPQNLFLLDRCLIMNRIKHSSGKELVLLNTHNSYYISEPELRMKELNIIRGIMLEEYKKGNYVVAGGDWNQFPPEYKNTSSIPFGLLQEEVNSMDQNFLPDDWQYAFDLNTPTNRVLKTAYEKSKTKLASIDYFIVSPNVNIEKVKAFDLGFEYSDHNPVFMEFILIEK